MASGSCSVHGPWTGFYSCPGCNTAARIPAVQTADLVLRTMQTPLVQLRPGSVVLSLEQVEQIKAKRDEAKKDAYGANYEAGAYDAYQNVLDILGADRKAEHPCPKGDDCALGDGAVKCLACGRNWPPDHTWDDRKAER